MFWEIFIKLCDEKGKSTSAVAKELNLSNSTTTKWKNGSTPNGETLCRIADYFNVTTDYLLERSEFRNAEIEKEAVAMMRKQMEELNLQVEQSESANTLKDEEIKNLKQKINDLFELILKMNRDYKEISGSDN